MRKQDVFYPSGTCKRSWLLYLHVIWIRCLHPCKTQSGRVKRCFAVWRIKLNCKNMGVKYRAAGACKDKNMRIPNTKDVFKWAAVNRNEDAIISETGVFGKTLMSIQPSSAECCSDLGREAQQWISRDENDLQFSWLPNSLKEQDQDMD